MQTSAFEYLRHGQTPFFRLPSVTWPEQPVDAIVVGVPHDGGVTYQPGARFAPYHVRRTSALVQSYHPGHKVDVFSRVKAVDAGNVVFPPFDRAAMRSAVTEMMGDAFAMRAAPFVVGGDHSITAPIVRAAAQTHGPLAVLHIDAHLDFSRARAARWIAANALAIGGRPLPVISSSQARVREEHIADFGDLLAAIAATPALVDPAALPAHWRLGLSALGVPVLDRPVDDALAAGASVIRLAA